MKKILSILLALTGMVLLTTGSALAEENYITYGDWLYELTPEGLVITAFTGLTEDVVIPDEIDGYKVSVIGDHAFAENHTMKTLVIPEGITAIRSEAFYGCSGLSYIEFNVKNCSVPDVWIYDSTKGAGVFSGAGSSSPDPLTVVFGDNVATIPAHLFDTAASDEYGQNGYPYASVANVVLSDGVKEIGECAFRCCEELKSITFGSGLKTIGDYAFSGCKSLPSLAFDDVLISIGNSSFYGNTSLENIQWGENLESIGDSAFSGCTSLEELSLINPLTSIGAHAFSDCTALKTLSLPESLVNMGTEAFYGCIKLNQIDINCVNLTEPDVWIYDSSKGGGVFSGAGSGSVDGLKVIFGEKVTKVPDNLFDTASTEEYGHTEYPYAFVTEVVFPAGVEEVGAYAFRSCQDLDTARFLGKDATFGEDAFAMCTSRDFHFECIPDGSVELYARDEGILVAPLETTTNDETWTCSNGHSGNTGKFCTECGEGREADSCPACGYEFPENTSYKFCPECGQPLE